HVVFIQIDPSGMRAFACCPSSDVAQPTAELYETVPRNKSGPPQQFASSAIVNCTDDAQPVVVASPGPEQVLVSDCRHHYRSEVYFAQDDLCSKWSRIVGCTETIQTGFWEVAKEIVDGLSRTIRCEGS